MKHSLAFFYLLAAFGAAGAADTSEFQNHHRLISVSGGQYIVGHPEKERNPARKVELKPFQIAEAETTNAQFAVFVKKTGYVTDAERLGFGKVAVEGMQDWEWEQVKGAHWRRPMGPQGPGWEDLLNHPVTQISGADAEAYCQWIGARLPSLEEWEVAARAGAKTLYPWGKDFDPKKANIWNGRTHAGNELLDGHLYTAPVKSFAANAWGLHDVIGNVFEYCSGLPSGTEPGDESRLIAGRGGSWWCSFGTCSFFNLLDIGTMDRHGSLSNQGFRIAKSGAASVPHAAK
jgi:sulfatase modifying factor 1